MRNLKFLTFLLETVDVMENLWLSNKKGSEDCNEGVAPSFLSTDSYGHREKYDNDSQLNLLSGGSLLKMIHSVPNVRLPVFQLLDLRKSKTGDYYKLTISDGVNSTTAVKLAPDKNILVENEELDKFCIFRTYKFRCIDNDGEKEIHLMDILVLNSGKLVGQTLGYPIRINNDDSITA